MSPELLENVAVVDPRLFIGARLACESVDVRVSYYY
jgi:hypothetical protein